MVRAPGRGIQVLSILAAVMLGLAQPLFEQLARSAEFFIVRGATTRELIALIAILCFFIPFLAFLFITLARILSHQCANGVHAVLLFLSLAALFLVGFNRVMPVRVWIMIPAITLAAAGIVWGFYKFNSIRHFFLFLAVVTFILPILFIRSPAISKIFFARQPVPPRIEVPSTIPVVLVIFDELPLSTLLDSSGQIDADHFPNFASLASRSFCFLNATTVADFTTQAIPAIVTGRYVRPDQFPLFSDHPENLFSLLGYSYDLVIFESATRLCPLEYTRLPAQKRSTSNEILSMLMDIGALYLHMILPVEYRTNLPAVNQVWVNFWGGGVSMIPVTADPLKSWNDFVDSIKASPKPALYFIHSQFPHSPWVFLPSGEYLRYDAEPPALLNLSQIPLNQNAVMVNRFRRHILQTAFTDLLLGKLLQKLSAAGLFDRSLIVVTADHGISFKNRTGPRGIRRDNFSDIMLVPLFIKLPGQREGQAIRRNVETVDILPTIAEVLQVSVPWTEGQSLVTSRIQERPIKRIFQSGTQKTHEFGPHMAVDPVTNFWKLTLIQNDPYFRAPEN